MKIDELDFIKIKIIYSTTTKITIDKLNNSQAQQNVL
jgi:hypothetical protein